MKRRAFSILEVLIAIGIVALLGASLAINFYKSHQERKEKDSVDLIESKLRMAAQLAKISDSEVRVLFGKDEKSGKFSIWYDYDLTTSDRIKAHLGKKAALNDISDIVLRTNIRDDLLAYFPWGLEDNEAELALFFRSGNQAVIAPAKYAPNVLIDDPAVVEALFPQEIVEDEKEEKQIHAS